MITVGKYKQGDVVFDRIRPTQQLIVERYSDRIYYCLLKEATKRRAIAYLERDLKADKSPPGK